MEEDNRQRSSNSSSSFFGFPSWMANYCYASPILATREFAFSPEHVEHPKPRRRPSVDQVEDDDNNNNNEEDKKPVAVIAENDPTQVTFFHDFVAGGLAGSASVIVGHPFDTIKVRFQASNNVSFRQTFTEFGGIPSLFRGMAAPLSAAAVINAIVFSSYGASSRFYDVYIGNPQTYADLPHDPWYKSMACGSFAGLMQCFVICPMEHVKCRLQVQHGKGSPDYAYRGPLQAARHIVGQHGVTRLYQGWWTTCWREVPAFGLYFAIYDYLKDAANTFLSHRLGASDKDNDDDDPVGMQHTHTWIASAFAGGCTGSITWGMVYPVDVIKTRIQISPLTTPKAELRLLHVGRQLVAQHGWRYLFRGLGITLVRAFPVNGTIFPVYEFSISQMTQWGL